MMQRPYDDLIQQLKAELVPAITRELSASLRHGGEVAGIQRDSVLNPGNREQSDFSSISDFSTSSVRITNYASPSPSVRSRPHSPDIGSGGFVEYIQPFHAVEPPAGYCCISPASHPVSVARSGPVPSRTPSPPPQLHRVSPTSRPISPTESVQTHLTEVAFNQHREPADHRGVPESPPASRPISPAKSVDQYREPAYRVFPESPRPYRSSNTVWIPGSPLHRSLSPRSSGSFTYARGSPVVPPTTRFPASRREAFPPRMITVPCPRSPIERRLDFHIDVVSECAVFQVGYKFYNVHRFFFNRDSVYFRTFFVEHECTARYPGILNGISAIDFDRFLSVLYPEQFDQYGVATVDEWTSILALSTKWSFASIRSLAIRQLFPIAPHVDKIVLGHEYDIPTWLEQAYMDVCRRPEPLTKEEGRRLGVDRAVDISRARQELRAVEILVHENVALRTVRAVFQLAQAVENGVEERCGDDVMTKKEEGGLEVERNIKLPPERKIRPMGTPDKEDGASRLLRGAHLGESPRVMPGFEVGREQSRLEDEVRMNDDSASIGCDTIQVAPSELEVGLEYVDREDYEYIPADDPDDRRMSPSPCRHQA